MQINIKVFIWLLSIHLVFPGAVVSPGAIDLTEKDVENLNLPTPKTNAIAKVENEASAIIYDVIQFANGDVLHGSLVAIDGTKSVVWKSPEAENDIIFKTSNITDIQLAPRKQSNLKNSVNSCVVKLTNGDELPGELKQLDKELLLLDTWYGGTLNIKRKTVQSIMLLKDGGGVVYDGSSGMEGWIAGRGRQVFRFVDGAFVANRPGLIGRDMKLPSRIRISFNAAWEGGLFFMISLFADSAEELYSNCYLMQFNTGYINLQRLRRNAGSRNLGQAEVLSLANKNKAKIEIFANRDQGIFALFIDDALVKQWKDNSELQIKGTCIHFQQQSVNTIRISNFRIEEWDGRLENRLGVATSVSEFDIVELVNHDKLSGKLDSIKDGKMKFATSFAEMEIPIERIYTIELASKEYQKFERKKGDVYGSFLQRGGFTFTIKSWSTNEVIGSHQSFGDFKFAASALNKITFNKEQKIEDTEILEPMDEGEQ